MVEPLSLAVVGTVALTEGIKFMYGQAGELLTRWREHKASGAAAKEAAGLAALDLAPPPGVFDLQPGPAEVRFEVVDRLADDIKVLRRVLGDYAEGHEDVPTDDPEILASVDALRVALEAALGRRLTFEGEARSPDSLSVEGEAYVREVEGRVAGVRAKLLASGRGSFHGVAKAERVKPGGRVAGVEIDATGAPPPPADRHS